MDGEVGTVARGRARADRGTPAAREVATADVLRMAPNEVLHAPARLYVAGDLELLSRPRVAVVGSRDASAAGARRARKIAAQLASAGVVVVSGLAKGIDTAAHEGAIAAGGRTIAVIGTGLDRAYPAAHAELQALVARDHLLVSQFPAGAQVHRSNFVARNRTMALLSHASVIVECGDTSGTLSQASEMQRLERPLFFMRSVLEVSGLTWPARFEAKGAIVLDDVAQILHVLPR